MPVFTTYGAPPNALSGSEVLLLSQGGQTYSPTLSSLTAVAMLQQASGQFYQNIDATINRMGDRLFVGGAANNLGITNRDASPTDWLSTVMGATSIGAWATYGAQFASLAKFGSTGILGGSQTSDAHANAALLGYVPSSIGIASWGISNDTTNPTTTTAYAFYGEAWRMPGADFQPCFGMELEAVNFGGLAVGISTPYHTNVGGGAYTLQLGSGGGQTSAVSDAAGVLVVVSNPTSFQKGIVFGATSLTGATGTSGDTGYAGALSLGRNHAVEWYAPDGNVGMFVRSTVTAGANQTRWEAQDTGMVISNAAGQALFTVLTAATVTNFLSIQSGVGTQAAGLYANEGPGGSPNIGLFPAAGGELQTTGPAIVPGNTLPANIQPAGWMHQNFNGADIRIPYFTAAQAGG